MPDTVNNNLTITKNNSRASYTDTASFKLAVIEYAEINGNRRAAAFYDVNETNVRL
ncbi:hypothetical protein ENBRE01_3157 [Enteropsectra breve]|nr:hypothetical protein ENBRE01_3157 [Enteropsectra breve]